VKGQHLRSIYLLKVRRVKQRKEIILVVEDEEIARKNLEHILEKEGYEVISVNSGAKALDLLKESLISCSQTLRWKRWTAWRF
jgi:PleD family two-component response regulator